MFTKPFIEAQIKENITAPRQWLLCWEFTGDKGQWRGTFMFSLICVWMKCWVNSRKASDLTSTVVWPSTRSSWTWANNYIPLFYLDAINHPCPNPDAGLANIFKWKKRFTMVAALSILRGCMSFLFPQRWLMWIYYITAGLAKDVNIFAGAKLEKISHNFSTWLPPPRNIWWIVLNSNLPDVGPDVFWGRISLFHVPNGFVY